MVRMVVKKPLKYGGRRLAVGDVFDAGREAKLFRALRWAEDVPELDELNINQLRAFAKANGIAIGRSSKADLLERIRSAECESSA